MEVNGSFKSDTISRHSAMTRCLGVAVAAVGRCVGTEKQGALGIVGYSAAIGPATLIIFCLLNIANWSDASAIQIEPISGNTLENPGFFQKFQSVIEDYAHEIKTDIALDDIGGMAVGIVVQDELIWSAGFGFADRESQTPVSPEHIFRVGSITKSFTAVLMMNLCEKGIVELDDQVSMYIPEIKELKNWSHDAGQITLRQLASHSAGLAKEPALSNAASGPVENWAEKTVECIKSTSCISLPGKEFHYSNFGYAILGLALSRAAEKSYCELVNERILKPLGMSDSFLVLSPEYFSRVASGYKIKEDGSIDAKQPFIEHSGRGYKMPNGAMYSTVKDLAAYISFISGARLNQLLSDNSLHALVNPQSPDGQYGFGFRISDDEDGFNTIWHGGSVAGYNAIIIYEPKTKVGIIMLRNYKGGKIDLEVRGREILRKLLKE